jgi:hypothetical protein
MSIRYVKTFEKGKVVILCQLLYGLTWETVMKLNEKAL